MSDRIARAFNKPAATGAVALDISKDFDKIWNAGLLHKLRSYGISSQIFGFISSSSVIRGFGCYGWEVFKRISS